MLTDSTTTTPIAANSLIGNVDRDDADQVALAIRLLADRHRRRADVRQKLAEIQDRQRFLKRGAR